MASYASTIVPERARPLYRPPKPLPYELREHCVIYFEEELCIYNPLNPQFDTVPNAEAFLPDTQGLTLLSNLLTSGTSFTTASGDPVPAFIPTPQQLSLAATLVVHPRLTTRAASKEQLQASNVAFRLLRNANKIVGPINANFAAAFTFSPQNTRKRSDGRRRTGGGDDSGDDSDMINTEIANAGSLWARAEDFWHAVGWAFNCSVAYPKRWGRWKLWLEFMLDVLEDDWAERLRMIEEDGDTSKNEPEEDLLAQSMIVQWLSGRKGAYGNKRRYIRAIFADGSAKAMAEFKEIFKNEPKERKTNGDAEIKRPAKVDIDQDVFGDYLDDDSDDEVEENTLSATTKLTEDRSSDKDSEILTVGVQPRRATTVTNGAERFGGMDSLILRQRLLSLVRATCTPTLSLNSLTSHTQLSTVSARAEPYFTPLEDLYDMYIDHIRPLPLPTFSLFVLPVLPNVLPAYRSSFNQLLLCSLIASSAPLEHSDDDLSQEILETCYLPFPANTHSISDNAKVSLLVESLLRLLATHKVLGFTKELEVVVETGVRAREMKAKGSTRKKRDELLREEEENWLFLRNSSRRMVDLVEFLKRGG
ncbi:hypothetical protein FGG08_005676 [Glutinoglossum americanum]|uniref:Uncharacterized protein n=1 Tax=Glutinoglossum americanum TaxID=1670608 RepID=A0A9P8HU33_9PEZI|nr:hypothetical protein FGG08_005676 [Glutinoglossum americanum]